MNASITDSTHPSIVYYDSDYPSKLFLPFPENFDETVWEQGIADDVDKYNQLTDQYGKKVLELCCGTGRITIPLVMNNCKVTAVDISSALLKRFKNKVSGITEFPLENLEIIRQDVTKLSLRENDFDIIICGFNSLLSITDFNLQQETLIQASLHLKPGGLLVIDIWNPFIINLQGDEQPSYFFKRKRVDNGNEYTRSAATGPMNTQQVQELYGWYDETQSSGLVTRIPYSMHWRIIFRYELELMLAKAGFEIKNIYGGNRDEILKTTSLKMFVEAIKIK